MDKRLPPPPPPGDVPSVEAGGPAPRILPPAPVWTGSSRQALHQVQLRLTRELQAHLPDLEPHDPPDLRTYAKTYRETVGHVGRWSSWHELQKIVARSQIVYLGDYHTLDRSQEYAVRLLEELDRPLVLGLEMVQARHQDHLQAFMAGELDETTFLDRIRYQETWGFPWASFRRFFELARRKRARVVGLNLAGTGSADRLRERDAFAADMVSALTVASPDAVVAVVFGDQHLAPPHIPGLVDQRLKAWGLERRTAIVHQNTDAVYWDLVRRGWEHRAEVVRLEGPGNRFCLITATPLAKLQSFVDWTNATGSDEEDVPALPLLTAGSREAFAEAVPEAGESPLDSLATLVAVQADFWGLPAPGVEDLSMMTPREFAGTPGHAARRLYHEADVRTARAWLQAGNALHLDRAKTMVVPRADLPRLAEMAGRLLVAAHRPAVHTLSPWPRTRLGVYRHILWDALAFAAVRVIDSKQPCRVGRDHAAFLAQHRGRKLVGEQAFQRDVARTVVAHQQLENRFLQQSGRPRFAMRSLDKLSPLHLAHLAKALGDILGDALHRGLLEETIQPEELAALFREDLRRPRAAFELYLDWLRRTQSLPGVAERRVQDGR